LKSIAYVYSLFLLPVLFIGQ